MTYPQIVLFSLLAGLFGMLLWGKLRYDVVAFGVLVLAIALGVVPEGEAFSGFGHHATIVIALVLVVSRGLTRTGAIELLARVATDSSRGLRAHIGIMAGLAAALSALMNNVAALAMLMPMDVAAAAKAKRSPALTLMPLSFATILGGMVTLIGTPPNIVIAAFRRDALGQAYTMFDFAPVGAVVAVVGVAYVALIGWRLIPSERREHDTGVELADLTGFVAEAVVPEGAKIVGQQLAELDGLADEHDVTLLGIVRHGVRLPGLARREELKATDVLVIEGGTDVIEAFAAAAGLEFVGAELHAGILGANLSLSEVVIPPGAPLVGRSALDLGILMRQGITLLGVSRRGRRFRDRVRGLKIRAGDVLLLLGPEERLPDVTAWIGGLALAGPRRSVKQRRQAMVAVGLFVAALVATSVGWLHLPLALAAVALAYVVLRIVPLGELYTSVEWPVIVLLGSLIPLGAALETSGGTTLLAEGLLAATSGYPPVVALALLMVVTMTLSDVLNNVATALIAAPIGVDVAARLGVSPDPFLMAVAVASSCAFLTPIGHKNNTIILGPGGYRFGDYWRMGLPLEALVIAVGLPMILWVWPL